MDGLLRPDLFKALSDPTRVSILACLMKCGRPCSVGEIAECCSVDLSVVSRHLAMLETAGVLASSRHGRVVSYAVRYADLCTTFRQLADAIEECGPANGRSTKGACCAPR